MENKSNKKQLISKALEEIIPKLSEREKQSLKSKLKYVPTLFLGLIERDKNKIRLSIPIGRALSFFVKLDSHKSWFKEYASFLTKICDYFLPKEARGYVEPRPSLRPNKMIFEYSIVEEDILRRKVKETILSYAPREELEKVKAHLIKEGLISEDFSPKAEFRDIRREIAYFLKGERAWAICPICGAKFKRGRRDNIYCSGKCRVAAYRKRKEKEKIKRR